MLGAICLGCRNEIRTTSSNNVFKEEYEVNYYDSIPENIYHRINGLWFVKEQIAVLNKERENLRISFYTDKELVIEEEDYFFIQLNLEDYTRLIPLYNFRYYPKQKKLYYDDTLKDTLIYIE